MKLLLNSTQQLTNNNNQLNENCRFPQQLMNLVNGKVALDRIQKFLKAEEMDQAPLAPSASPAINIGISQQAAFAWAPSGPPMLKNINLSIPAGRLVLAVGSVGSGKSSLLAAVLGEMHAVSGKVEVKGTTAYTQQDPWIQNATLKENSKYGLYIFDLINLSTRRTVYNYNIFHRISNNSKVTFKAIAKMCCMLFCS